MRKNTSFTVAAAVMGVAMVFWVKSAVVASSADVRAHASTPLYFVTSAPYLPVRMAEPVW
jgi:hypothetical protein